LPLDLVAHLQEGALTRAPARLGYVPVAATDGRLRLQHVEQPADFVDIDPGIPDVEETHRGVPRHLGAIAAHGQPRGGMGIAVLIAVVPRSNGEAGRQPLDVPFEWRGKRLIEVVDVEDQPPVGCGVHAEIQQVRVTARLHPDIGGGRMRQIPCHRSRGAAEVGKRRGQHAPVADRYQIRHPGPGLLLQNGNRVWPVRGRRPLGVA
jgi:hypothetical protein